jgi:Leucine-rich repeat (LRR) protein
LAGEKCFPVLKNLYLAHNELIEFDEKFANCTQLEELYLHHNKMTKLPNFIAQFKNLKVLQVHNNLLIEFPNWFVEMPKIEEITLYNNFITDLPFEQLEKIKHLKKFHFSGNLIADDELRSDKMKELLQKWDKKEVNYDF